MYSQKSGLYRSLEFDGATYNSLFNEELQWLMMEGQALLASEQMGLWVDTSEREACTNPIDLRSNELAILQSEPISMQWTNELRRNIELHPRCELLTELLSLNLYTRAVVYPFLIKGWSPRRIADHFKVSLVTIQKVLEIGLEQLKRNLERPA